MEPDEGGGAGCFGPILTSRFAMHGARPLFGISSKFLKKWCIVGPEEERQAVSIHPGKSRPVVTLYVIERKGLGNEIQG